MRLSKQHKIYGAVLGLAVAALGVDRFFFTAPAEASEVAAVAAAAGPATPFNTARPKVAAAKPAAATEGDAAVGARAIAARLDDLAQTAGLRVDAVRDAFAPSTEWVKPAPADDALAAAKVAEARRFAGEHRLTAVMGGERQGVAVVDGKPLRPGQTVGGFRLVSVSARARDSRATFERNGVQFDLRLQDVAGGAAAVAQAN